HSGDSASVLPPFKVPAYHQRSMRRIAARLARRLGVVGLLNVQFAVKDGTIYVIEANPRASRTIPWVAKAIGLPLVKLATRVILGERLTDLIPSRLLEPFERGDSPAADGRERRGESLLPAGRVFVKMPVFSANRFPEVDTLLGPEMRSTGEVLGIAPTFGEAFAKAAAGAGLKLPLEGTAFLTVNDRDKEELLPIARDLAALGFRLIATRGTTQFLTRRGLACESIYKVNEGHPNVADRIAEGGIQLVINTPLGRVSFYDESAIRKSALAHGVPCITTLSGSRAAVDAIRALRAGDLAVESLQELHARAAARG
ncbi:MAG: ATP-grasp domain-containing protein, partial [Candidatus Eisenbacteria bacterium]